MALYIIGLGLSDEKDITIKGLEAAKRCKYLYLDYYTSILQCPKEKLEQLIGKPIALADRTQLENNSAEVIKQAQKEDVALLVAGDGLAATTHINFLAEGRQSGVQVKVIHNASIFSAVSITGLQLYKFGKVTSVPFQASSGNIETPYQIIKQNSAIGMHTLVLLDLDPIKQKFMTIKEALGILGGIEVSKDEAIFCGKTLIGISRLGSVDQVIKSGTFNDLVTFNFGKPPYCLIIPADELHFMEEEALEMWK